MTDNSYPQILSIASKYKTDDIFVIGKGPSVDQVDPSIFKEGLVINLNDSERIIAGDICVFHSTWVTDSLRGSGFKASLYISPFELPDDVPHLKAAYVPTSQESSQLMYQRFLEEELTIEGVLLVTALKIAKIVADVRMRRQRIYFVGFDFNMGKGYSKKISHDYSGDEKSFQANIISTHEHYFVMFSYLLRESNLLINHVGNKSYSRLSCGDLNRRFADQSGVESLPLGSPTRAATNMRKAEASSSPVDGSRGGILVVAELTTNHFGDLDRLEKMIRRASDCGADLIKLQKRNVETFYTARQLDSPYDSPFGSSFRDYRNALELDEKDFRNVDEICRSVGVDWFVSVLDLPSFRFIQPFDRNFVKLPSTISQHREFLEIVAKEFKGAVVVSTGFTDQAYEDYVLETFRNQTALFLLQCTSAYPTPPEDCNIAVVRHYHELSGRHRNLVPGYSSHDFGSTGCMLAVAAGARMVEKHVKFGDTDWAHFDSVAIDLDGPEFAIFVKNIRLAEKITGSEVKRPMDTEHHKYWAPA